MADIEIICTWTGPAQEGGDWWVVHLGRQLGSHALLVGNESGPEWIEPGSGARNIAWQIVTAESVDHAFGSVYGATREWARNGMRRFWRAEDIVRDLFRVIREYGWHPTEELPASFAGLVQDMAVK